MQNRLCRNVEKRWWEILLWTVVFLLGVVMISGHVALYELNLKNQAYEQQLQEMQTELGTLRKNRQRELNELDVYAQAAGMYRPEPEEYIIVHVRGQMEASNP